MMILGAVLGTMLFVGAVAALSYILATHTRRDAERWLADRRIHERRLEPDKGSPAGLPERREGDRRTSDQQSV